MILLYLFYHHNATKSTPKGGLFLQSEQGEYSPCFIFVDATYLNRNLCLLIVRDDKHVLGFRWAKTENFYEYYELLKVIREPKFVICDGHFGIIKAVRQLWPNAGIQRCLVHISRDCERKLGKRSPCFVNQIFREHINKLPVIDTIKKSQNWLEKFDKLYEQNRDFIEEKTPRIDIETGEILRFDRTHKNLFSACHSIQILREKDQLFLHLKHQIPNNSNSIEGGINSPLKNLLRCHRGVSLEHQKRMFEWYLLSRSKRGVKHFLASLDLNAF